MVILYIGAGEEEKKLDHFSQIQSKVTNYKRHSHRPSLFTRDLFGQDKNAERENQLKEMLTDIRKATNAYTDEEFEEAMDQTFVFSARNPDGSEGEEIELCAGGKQRRLTRSNTEEFISLTVRIILNRTEP